MLLHLTIDIKSGYDTVHTKMLLESIMVKKEQLFFLVGQVLKIT